jgi:hypothetical protein
MLQILSLKYEFGGVKMTPLTSKLAAAPFSHSPLLEGVLIQNDKSIGAITLFLTLSSNWNRYE